MSEKTFSPLDRSGLNVIGIGGASPQGKGGLAIERGLDMTGEQKPTVLIVPTPKRTKEAWEKTVPGTMDYFSRKGLAVDVLHRFEEYNPDEMQDKVNEADLIYTTGGDTLHMMEVLGQHKITAAIAARALEGKVVLTGASAGAIMPTTWGHSDSLSYRPETAETWDYIRVDGLGLVPIAITPHYSNTDARLGARSDKFKEMLRGKDGDGIRTAIGVDNFASYEVHNGLLVPFTPYPGENVHVLSRSESGSLDSRIMEAGESIPLDQAS